MELFQVLKKSKVWLQLKHEKEKVTRIYYTEWNKSERERQILYINAYMWNLKGFPDSLVGKESAIQETPFWFLGWEDPLQKGKATHSSILAWRIPLTV